MEEKSCDQMGGLQCDGESLLKCNFVQSHLSTHVHFLRLQVLQLYECTNKSETRVLMHLRCYTDRMQGLPWCKPQAFVWIRTLLPIFPAQRLSWHENTIDRKPEKWNWVKQWIKHFCFMVHTIIIDQDSTTKIVAVVGEHWARAGLIDH